MDFDNRFTLLELFAETTSSEEHGISFEGIHLPQVSLSVIEKWLKKKHRDSCGLDHEWRTVLLTPKFFFLVLTYCVCLLSLWQRLELT